MVESIENYMEYRMDKLNEELEAVTDTIHSPDMCLYKEDYEKLKKKKEEIEVRLNELVMMGIIHRAYTFMN